MSKLILVFVAASLFATIYAFNPPVKPKAPKLRWMTLQEAEQQRQKQQKPILIDLYTDWCGWCKVMDRKTYADKNVIAYIEEHFYPVKLDAETKSALRWNGKSFAFNTSYRANEFAVYLTQGRLSFPTTVIIPADGVPQAIPGYLKPAELESIVKYFGEQRYGRQSFDDYHRNFKASW